MRSQMDCSKDRTLADWHFAGSVLQVPVMPVLLLPSSLSSLSASFVPVPFLSSGRATPWMATRWNGCCRSDWRPWSREPVGIDCELRIQEHRADVLAHSGEVHNYGELQFDSFPIPGKVHNYGELQVYYLPVHAKFTMTASSKFTPCPFRRSS